MLALRMRKVFLLLMIAVFLVCFVGQAQDSTAQNRNNRIWIMAGAQTAFYGGTLLVLNSAWYKDYPKTSFHTFDDSGEWLQMDKIGHAWSVYSLSKNAAQLWRWAGLSRRKAGWVGSASAAGYLTLIEFLDAHSAEWGWSWSDMAANIGGAGLYGVQEGLWEEQRIQFKFSYHPQPFSDPSLNVRADDLYGSNWYEKMLKDYNGQTYWLSGSPHSFAKNSNWPAWLNIAVGYGGNGMLGGFANNWTDGNGLYISRSDVPRVRQFYLAPDIDFTKIPTKKKGVRVLLNVLNAFKCPAPTLMLDGKGKLRFYPVYF